MLVVLLTLNCVSLSPTVMTTTNLSIGSVGVGTAVHVTVSVLLAVLGVTKSMLGGGGGAAMGEHSIIIVNV